nr:protein IQ-DOMAIN 14-like [Lolium perenne]
MFVGSDDSGSSDLMSYYYIGCDNRHELGSDALVFWRNRRLLHRLLGSRGHHLFRNDPRFLRMWRSKRKRKRPTPTLILSPLSLPAAQASSLPAPALRIAPSPVPPIRRRPPPPSASCSQSSTPPTSTPTPCSTAPPPSTPPTSTPGTAPPSSSPSSAPSSPTAAGGSTTPSSPPSSSTSPAWCCSPCPRGSRRCGRRRARGSRAHRPPGSSSPLLRGAVPDLHRHGGVKSALLPFAAEQYDVDGGPEQAPRKQSFFTWFFGAINLGIFVTGTLVSWLQQNVSWALGFGVSALCLLLAAIGFLPGTPWYRIQRPVGHSRAYSSIAPPPTVAVARCSHSPVEMRPRTTTWVTGGGTRLPGIVNDKGGA